MSLSNPHFNKTTKSWRLRTISHPEFTELYFLFYENKRKVVPKSIKQILKSPLSLAIWFMDDETKGPQKGYTLNNQNFTLEENKFLVEILKCNFGLEFVSIHRDKKYYRLYIKRKSANKFADLIRP